MGNQCKSSFCGDQDLKLGVNSSPNFDKLIHSQRVENQFPEQLIPETVKQKIKLLHIETDLRNSQIWKYQDSQINQQDPFNVAYAIISKEEIQNKSSQQLIANKNVPPSENQQQNSQNPSGQNVKKNDQKKSSIDPNRFQNATIFLFKSSLIYIKGQNIQNSNPPIKTMTLKKVYRGPVNSLMKASNAIIILENGDNYQGNVLEFNFEGKGSIRNSLGNHFYEGIWQNNKPNGLGVEQITDKFKYEGDFINGKWHGKGKLSMLGSSNKYLIDGTFLEGNIQGPGKVFSRNGQLVYDGLFSKGKQHGPGKWFGSHGQSYEGDFVNGKKEGFGKYIFKSGRQYEGNFKDDKPEGEGQLIEDNRRVRGYWYKGQNILTKSVIEK